MIVVLKKDHDFAAGLRPFEYNTLSRKRVRQRYGFDVLVAEEGEPEYQEYVDFFAQVRSEPGQIKGMLEVTL